MNMDTHQTDPAEEPVAETPEDVAILYSWANLHGAKYRDFSASRREYRAQVRHRAAEETRQTELEAQAEAERAAAEAERAAREAERVARNAERFESAGERERALRQAEDATRRAGAERVEAARRAEAAAAAESAARQEEREIAEAHASAQRQAARWHDSEIRRRAMAGPQPTRVPALGGDPYEMMHGATVDGDLPTPNRALEYTQPQRYREEAGRSEERRNLRPVEAEHRHARGYKPDQASGVRPVFRAQPPVEMPVRSRIHTGDSMRIAAAPLRMALAPEPHAPVQENFPAEPAGRAEELWPQAAESSAPAWLYGVPASLSRPGPQAAAPGPPAVSDTLQHSRERVASRWFALKGVFEGEGQPVVEQPRHKEVRTPVLAIFSLAGGVGKTSMVATLGRALSSQGEKVLLTDTTSHALLPYYFGATELKPGVIRTFSPPTGSADAPIHLVSYECEARSHERGFQEALAGEMIAAMNGSNRVLLDINSTSGWVIRRLARMSPIVLVPVAPDMNSVISLHSVERYFQGAVDGEGRPIRPLYLINHFDSSLPLHLDVREVLRRQLGDRLLPFAIRRSPAVSEALAEGMTVVDYSPEGTVSEDYQTLANWLRGIAPPASQGLRTTWWSER